MLSVGGGRPSMQSQWEKRWCKHGWLFILWPGCRPTGAQAEEIAAVKEDAERDLAEGEAGHRVLRLLLPLML